MLHVAIDDGDNRSCGGKRAFDECAAQPTAPDPLNATDPEITLGYFTAPVSRAIRAVIVNNDDLVAEPIQDGLNGRHQSVDVFDLIEGRDDYREFEGTCGQLGIFMRSASR
jgi:hypothetical protein